LDENLEAIVMRIPVISCYILWRSAIDDPWSDHSSSSEEPIQLPGVGSGSWAPVRRTSAWRSSARKPIGKTSPMRRLRPGLSRYPLSPYAPDELVDEQRILGVTVESYQP
jgi:hypothetical protein